MGDITEYDKTVLRLAEQRIEHELSRSKTARDRASNLIQINLVVLGVFTSIMLGIIGKPINFTAEQTYLVLFGISFLSLSMFLSLITIWPSKGLVFDIVSFDKKHYGKETSEKFDILVKTLFKIIDDISNKADFRIQMLFVAYVFMTLGIIIMAFTSIGVVLRLNV